MRVYPLVVLADFRDLPALYISSPPKIHSPPYSSGAAGLLFSQFQVSWELLDVI